MIKVPKTDFQMPLVKIFTGIPAFTKTVIPFSIDHFKVRYVPGCGGNPVQFIVPKDAKMLRAPNGEYSLPILVYRPCGAEGYTAGTPSSLFSRDKSEYVPSTLEIRDECARDAAKLQRFLKETELEASLTPDQYRLAKASAKQYALGHGLSASDYDM